MAVVSNIIYETPNKEWIIKRQHDPAWDEVLGIHPVYLLCKYDQDISDWYRYIPTYMMIRAESSLRDCFMWLRNKNIISQDEYLAEVEKCQEQH